MAPADLPAVCGLLEQLGYSLIPEELVVRLSTVMSTSDHALFVAAGDTGVCGLLHVYCRPALEKPAEAVVQALVVDVAARGLGVGRHLMKEAERWAAESGLPAVCLSSHVSRAEAHAFYERLGYRPAATALWLRKALG